MEVVEDLQEHLGALIAAEISPLEIVVIEEAPDYPGELVFQVFEGEQVFYTRYKDWVSVYCVLSELYNLPAFIEALATDGWTVVFGPSCERILKDYERWSEPLAIEGYALYGFQQFSLQRAFETDFWFFNWATGAGKSFTCAAGAKELFARQGIDQVIFCTMASFKYDQVPFFERAGLDVVVNDGTKAKRRRGYGERRQVYVMNYEKLNFDHAEIEELVAGANTLFIFDECHKIITADKQNLARQSFERLIRLAGVGSKIWAMSASVVDGNPLKFRDVFAVGRGRTNALGSKSSFETRYADKITPVELKTPKGRSFYITNYDWNLGRLQEVRHRVGDMTQTARKTDPGIAPLFKGLATILEPVHMAPQQAELTEAVIDAAWEAYHRDENLGPYYDLLRYTCNTPLALAVTEHEVGRALAEQFAEEIPKIVVAKTDKLNERLESIREQGDKVLVFTHWTNLTLHLIRGQIAVPHVVHYGVGMTDKDRQAAKAEFKTNPDITCFFTSDAGAHGLNMQEARYVIQYEPTYSYDQGMQRASRIHRADSYLDGLTNYVLITAGSVEERVWDIQQCRRIISGAVQGTQELLNYGQKDLERAKQAESANYQWLLFGDR